MICPSCNGEKQSCGFVDGYDAETGKKWGDYRAIPCFTCKGNGEVDDGYPERRAWGERVRRARIDQSITYWELAAKAGLDFGRYTRIEAGIEAATPSECERIDAVLAGARR